MSKNKKSKLKGFFLSTVFCLLSTNVFTQPAPKVATLKDVKGDVQVQKAGVKSWIPAIEGMKIQGGDKIKTKAKSEAKIIWDDGNVVKLSSYTDFLINKAAVDNTTGVETTSTHLSIGRTFINIKKAMAPGSSFEVSTPSSICGVRSTKFKVEVDGKGDTTIATYDGTVYNSAQGEEKNINAGNKCKTEKGKLPCDEEPQDVLDAIEQEEEADVVGKVPEEEKKEEEKKAEEEKAGKPITLTIESPASDMDTEEDKIKIIGTTDPDAKLLINGVGANPNAFGKFEMEVTLNEGENTVTIIATNPAGKTITITRKIKKTKKEKPKEEVDTTPPILTITEPADNTTVNTSSITVKGTTEPNAKVTVNGNPASVSTAGSFEAGVNLIEGTNKITTDATDLAGNKATAVRTVIYKAPIIDTVPPVLTISQPTDNLITNLSAVTVIGQTEVGAKVKVQGEPVSVGSDGSFTKTITLSEGVNNIKVGAADAAGNISTIAVKVTVDSIQPMLNISQPANNVTTNTPMIVIIGTTEAGTKVTIKGTTIIAGSDGSFTHSITLVDGLNTITIKAADRAGNISTAILNITLKIIPFFLTVSEPPDELKCTISDPKCAGGNVTIVGFTEKDAKVTINGVSVYVDPSGSFTHPVKLVEGTNTFTIKAVSKNNEMLQAIKRVTYQESATLILDITLP